MQLHATPGGESPLPALDNVLGVNKLHSQITSLGDARAKVPLWSLFHDVCGRPDCPVSIDFVGNIWCWCRTSNVRDLCD